MSARLAAAVVATALAGCAWFDAGPPDRSCKTDRDCFRAQGEVCDQARHECALAVDAAVVVDAPIDATILGAVAPGAVDLGGAR